MMTNQSTSPSSVSSFVTESGTATIKLPSAELKRSDVPSHFISLRLAPNPSRL